MVVIGQVRRPLVGKIEAGDVYQNITVNSVYFKRIAGNGGKGKRLFDCSCDCGIAGVISAETLEHCHRWNCGCQNGTPGSRLFPEVDIYTEDATPKPPRMRKQPFKPRNTVRHTDVKKVRAKELRNRSKLTEIPTNSTRLHVIADAFGLQPALVGIIDLPTRDWRRVGCVALN